FTPLPGCFSPFPHGTGSLSVTREYLALGDGPPGFRRNYTCSAVLRIQTSVIDLSSPGLSPSVIRLPMPFDYICNYILSVLQPQRASSLVWALSVSLAATQEIEFSFSSYS